MLQRWQESGIKIKKKGLPRAIRQLPSGSWRVQISMEGHRVSHTSKTRRECQNWVKKITRQIDDGLTYAYTKLTMSDYLIDWLAMKKTTIRQTSWVQYYQVIRSYIIPRIGRIKITELRTDQVQGLYNRLLEQTFSAHVVHKIHTILNSALNNAVKIGILARNPARYAMKPIIQTPEMSIIEESQISQLLVTVTGHRWEALFFLAIATGARQNELLGLKWTDLDWIKRTLKIERQLVLPDGKGIRFSPTKTRYGKRAVELGPKTIEMLRKHFDDQQMLRRVARDSWQENGLIFTTSFGTPIHPRNLLREFKSSSKLQV